MSGYAEVDPDENTVRTNNAHLDEYLVQGRRVVRNMPMKIFQRCLIEHFDIRFNQNTLVWPIAGAKQNH